MPEEREKLSKPLMVKVSPTLFSMVAKEQAIDKRMSVADMVRVLLDEAIEARKKARVPA